MATSGSGKKKSDRKKDDKNDLAKKLPFATRHDLSDATRTKVVAALNQTLAEIFDLQSQIKQAHWNVKGASFFGLHKLFDEIAGTLTEPVDTVAERILSLGGFAKGSVRLAAAASTLPELPAEFRQEDIVGDIADRVALAAKLARKRIDDTEDAGDKVSSDLLIEITAILDKALYFLEAYQFRA
ncbi:MAG TPA: DNA starvation/stationary phase protection protein Dps [Arenimonas sp.]|nr:DNA starvation/stationary phase protection protein Dps [Arenimonas sp.]HOZ04804.1 DNA starvation/stationary phase protection protein Dps [Arenimonas sp.]HPO23195.1 DNA starvation/stationary phase protection protein Dps [Arenimonas sp.]